PAERWAAKKGHLQSAEDWIVQHHPVGVLVLHHQSVEQCQLVQRVVVGEKGAKAEAHNLLEVGRLRTSLPPGWTFQRAASKLQTAHHRPMKAGLIVGDRVADWHKSAHKLSHHLVDIDLDPAVRVLECWQSMLATTPPPTPVVHQSE